MTNDLKFEFLHKDLLYESDVLVGLPSAYIVKTCKNIPGKKMKSYSEFVVMQ